MEVLYVSRSNSGTPHPFIQEQASALMCNHGIRIQHFLIRGGGLGGYIRAMKQLTVFLKKNKIDIIHVHYGISALATVLNDFFSLNKHKIIITFHGSDLNKASERHLSLLAARMSWHNILVSEKMLKYFTRRCSVIPCGIDTNINIENKEDIRKSYGWGANDFVLLFSSNFERKEKDPDFAFKVVDALSKETTKSVKFIELNGFSRSQLTCLMQAADALLMCSVTEGSPQVIKEAILNSLPVVSNDVGDVKYICSEVDNCFIIPKKVEEYVKCLLFLSQVNTRIQNRSPVLEKYDNVLISNKLFSVYSQALK